MPELQARIAAAVGRVVTNASNWPDAIAPHLLGRDLAEPIEKITDALAPVIRAAKVEALRAGLHWFSEAVEEAAQKAPAPSATPDLASAYWDGYRAASREITDLITEPKLAEKAIARVDNLVTE